MLRTIFITVLLAGGLAAQSANPLAYSIATPRPINPAAGSTDPSAQATQSLNPYLGSVPGGKLVEGEIKLTLEDAIQRGLNFNLGLIDSQQAEAGVRAERERAFAALLPQITARAQESYQQVSIAELGIKFPAQTGIHLPPTTGGYEYSEGRVAMQFAAIDPSLRDRYRARRASEAASELSKKNRAGRCGLCGGHGLLPGSREHGASGNDPGGAGFGAGTGDSDGERAESRSRAGD